MNSMLGCIYCLTVSNIQPPGALQDVIPEDRQPEMLANIAKGEFSFRTLKEQFQSILKLGPMSQVRALLMVFLICIRAATGTAKYCLLPDACSAHKSIKVGPMSQARPGLAFFMVLLVNELFVVSVGCCNSSCSVLHTCQAIQHP